MKLKPNVSFRQTEPNLALLVDASGSTLYAVNGPGIVLGKALANGATRADLVAALKSTFDNLPNDEKIERDVDAFLENLRENGFLAEDENA